MSTTLMRLTLVAGLLLCSGCDDDSPTAPSPTDWFHARIVVKETKIQVYVNGSTTPSLSVNKLNSRTSGLVGIWNNGLDGEFANLVIKK